LTEGYALEVINIDWLIILFIMNNASIVFVQELLTWNSLRDYVVDAVSANSFKARHCKHRIQQVLHDPSHHSF